MIFEGVNFCDEQCRKMTKTEFERRHISLFWQNRSLSKRKAMLAQAYVLIKGKDNK